MNASPPRSPSSRGSLARCDGARLPSPPRGPAGGTTPWTIAWRLAVAWILAPVGFGAEEGPNLPTPSPQGLASPAALPPASASPSSDTNAATASAASDTQVPPPSVPAPTSPRAADSPSVGSRSERDTGRSRRSDRRRDRGGDATDSSSTSTNAAPSSRDGTDFESFQLIPDRNIFNANRSARASRTNREPPPREPRVDTLALVGSMSYTKGDFAFFDGSSTEFRRVLKAGDSIAGFQLLSIGRNSVQLEAAGKTQELAIGSHFRREEAGEWRLVAESAPASAFASGGAGRGPQSGSATGDTSASGSGSNAGAASASATPDSGGSADDILQRLMKKREQEMK